MPEQDIQSRAAKLHLDRLWVVPIAIAAISCMLSAMPITRPFAYWMIVENHPVELLTFILLFAGGFIGMKLAMRIRSAGWVRAFYLVFSLGLLVTAMEEIAWGQQFLGFETPESISRINAQGETTLHNIKGMQGRSEVFRLAFSYAGLAGILLARMTGQWFRRIAPHRRLLPWFLVIAAFESVNAFNDVFPIQESFDHFVGRFSEVTELLIAATGLLYVWHKWNDERVAGPRQPTVTTDVGERQAA